MHPQSDSNVVLGDCLPILQQMPGERFNLIYLDPPFFTQRSHALQPRDRSRTFSFSDSWSTADEYACFLFKRLTELRRVMSATGSIYFHCDRNAVHIARTVLDQVFGIENFRAEIIWHYRRWSNAAKGLLPAHQTILYYTKSKDFVFNQVFEEYSPSTNVDQILQRRSRDDSNKSTYLRDDDGQVVPHAIKRGVPLSDVWDIPFLNPKAKERVGYPTQKPLLLLERIIGLSSNEGDNILDPFCGSGTTLVAADLMRRSATGIDISEEAVNLAKSRLAAPVRSHSLLHENGRESYRAVDETALRQLVGLEYVPIHRNSGIDAILKQDWKGSPVTIRVQRAGEPLLQAAESLRRASISRGARIMFVIAIERGGTFDFANALPPGIVAIDSPALCVREYLEKLASLDPQVDGGPTDHSLLSTAL